MRFAFVDFVYGYDAARPDTDLPLGGTTSAICFLARELTQNGVACVLFNRITETRKVHGITAQPLHRLADELGDQAFDAIIFCGRWTRDFVQLVRGATKKPLIAWMHESLFREPLTPACDEFDGVVYVSEWQKQVNETYAKPHWRHAIVRNAMNPAVADSFPVNSPIRSAKKQPPVLLFAGSFARGAFHIPPILDKIRATRSDFTAKIFCNLDPSGDKQQDATYMSWLRNQPNITHVGMVGQSELARHMKSATVFLSPNPWPETSCIVLIEALASGLLAVVTKRAALPETAHGFAELVPIEGADDPLRFDAALNHDAFAARVLEHMEGSRENGDLTEQKLRKQVDFFLANYQWGQRVALWQNFIAAF